MSEIVHYRNSQGAEFSFTLPMPEAVKAHVGGLTQFTPEPSDSSSDAASETKPKTATRKPRAPKAA